MEDVGAVEVRHARSHIHQAPVDLYLHRQRNAVLMSSHRLLGMSRSVALILHLLQHGSQGRPSAAAAAVTGQAGRSVGAGRESTAAV